MIHKDHIKSALDIALPAIERADALAGAFLWGNDRDCGDTPLQTFAFWNEAHKGLLTRKGLTPEVRQALETMLVIETEEKTDE